MTLSELTDTLKEYSYDRGQTEKVNCRSHSAPRMLVEESQKQHNLLKNGKKIWHMSSHNSAVFVDYFHKIFNVFNIILQLV